MISMMVLAVISSVAYAADGEDYATKTFIYTLKISGGREQLRRAANSMKISNPDIKKALIEIADEYSYRDIASRASAVIHQGIDNRGAKSCVSFINSKAGGVLLHALRGTGNMAETKAALKSIPAAYKPSINQFFQSKCYRQANVVASGASVSAIQAAYGHDMMCLKLKSLHSSLYQKACL